VIGLKESHPVRLLFVISTLGERPAELRRLLDCLAGEEPGAHVLVADQSENENVGKIAADFDFVQVIPSARGLSVGRNACLSAASLEEPTVVMFPNDNTWYPPGVLSTIRERMISRGLDVLAGRLVYADGSSPFPVPMGCTQLRRENAALAMSATLAIRSSFFADGLAFEETIGAGAPSPYQAAEETDLLLRILAAGGRAELHADLLVCGEDATRSLPLKMQIRKTWGYSRAHTYVLRRHKFPRRSLAIAVLRPFVRVFTSLVKLDVRQSVLAMTRFLGRCRGVLP
jgi:hypothetical protein